MIGIRWNESSTFNYPDTVQIISYFIYFIYIFLYLHSYNTSNADHIPFSRTAVQHADDGYYKRGNSGSLLVHYILKLPDGTNVYGSRGVLLEKIRCSGLKV